MFSEKDKNGFYSTRFGKRSQDLEKDKNDFYSTRFGKRGQDLPNFDKNNNEISQFGQRDPDLAWFHQNSGLWERLRHEPQKRLNKPIKAKNLGRRDSARISREWMPIYRLTKRIPTPSNLLKFPLYHFLSSPTSFFLSPPISRG